jgi:hypothetical protein|tara:strand:- start:2352 stop:3395 length:1044 start_codon:yes stop_codon:yes gene_type:complete
MASTYTSELRFEKIATGEQSGSWGNTTNTQYDLFESTISGTATVAFASDGDDTLTTANGADDEARHMFINLTGGTSLSTTRNLVVPTKSKLYFVRNNTNGSQSVIVKTSGGSGITVPHGKYMCLYCDGTNVVDAANYQTAMTIGTMTSASVAITGGSVTGITDLVVADGGTGASSLTDGGVLLGSGTGAITAMAVLGDGEMIVGDGTTDPVAESGSTLRASIGVAIGSDVQAFDADTLKADTADNLTAGFSTTVHDAGTKSSGTYTPDQDDGNIQRAINGGAHTLAPTVDDCAVIIQYTNNASAGTITTSGFTLVDGDDISTTNGDDFFFYLTKANGFSLLTVKALQ